MIWTAHLIGFACLLQTIEHLVIFSRLRSLDPWRSNSILDRLEIFLLISRGIAALVTLFSPQLFVTLVLFTSVYFTAVRYRGTFNGGSDTTTLHVLVAVMISQMGPPWEMPAMVYLGVYLSLSYFVAGVSKLLSSDWRNGLALSHFLQLSNSAYPSIGSSTGFRVSNFAMLLGSWFVIVWECAFPLGLFNATVAQVAVGLGVLFHLANVYIFGLNRFFWAWLAAYPALLLIHGLPL